MPTEITKLYELKARKRSEGAYTTKATRSGLLVPLSYVYPLISNNGLNLSFLGDNKLDSFVYMFAEQAVFFKRWVSITHHRMNNLVLEAVHKRSEAKQHPVYWQLQGIDGDELLGNMERKNLIKVHPIAYKNIGFLLEPTETLAALIKDKDKN